MRHRLSLTLIVALLPAAAAHAGTVLYLTDSSPDDNTIYTLSDSGQLAVFASGQGLASPWGLAFDAQGNLYTANQTGNSISKITPGGAVSTFASSASLDSPTGIAFDSLGNLYAANFNSGTISKITPGGAVSTFATGLTRPEYLAFDKAGNLYATQESGTAAVVKISPAGISSTFALNGFSGGYPLLLSPEGLAFNSAGTLFVSDNTTSSVEAITPTGSVSTFVASGALGTPAGQMAFDASGNLYETSLFDIFRISPSGSPTIVSHDLFTVGGIATPATAAVPLPPALWPALLTLTPLALLRRRRTRA